MKSYHVKRTDSGVKVDVNVESVDSIKTYSLPHDVRHSPDGFEYGYAGSGPSELARCILLDMGFDVFEIDQCYHSFKLFFITSQDRENDGFILYEDGIREWWNKRHGGTDV